MTTEHCKYPDRRCPFDLTPSMKCLKKLPKQGNNTGGECASLLRAMANNYIDGHKWDRLDGEAVSKAADEIDRLHDLINEQRDRIRIFNDILGKDTSTEAMMKLAGLEADADRYRWLRAVNSGSIGITTISTDPDLEYVLVETEADTAIDAAMALTPNDGDKGRRHD